MLKFIFRTYYEALQEHVCVGVAINKLLLMTDIPNFKKKSFIFFIFLSLCDPKGILDIKCVTKCWKIFLLQDVSLALYYTDN